MHLFWMKRSHMNSVPELESSDWCCHQPQSQQPTLNGRIKPSCLHSPDTLLGTILLFLQKCLSTQICQFHGHNSFTLTTSSWASEWGRKGTEVPLNLVSLLVPGQPVWVVQKLLIYWDFPHPTMCKIYKEWFKEEKKSSLLMVEIRPKCSHCRWVHVDPAFACMQSGWATFWWPLPAGWDPVSRSSYHLKLVSGTGWERSTSWMCRVNMDQNLWGLVPSSCWKCETMN